MSQDSNSMKSYNTSNLVSHLKSSHPDEYTKFSKLKTKEESERDTARREKTKASGIGGLCQIILHDRSMEKVKQWDINDSRVASVHKKLGEMIALDCQLLTIVEDIGFNCFVKVLEPRYAIPSRKYFSENVIPKIHDGVKAEVMRKYTHLV